MYLSVVVLSFNSKSHLGPCLDALLKTFKDLAKRCEVIVVENGSHDGSKEILKEYEKSNPEVVRGIYSPENLGTTVSRNLALRKCEGDYIMILDSDARTDTLCVTKLVERLVQDPSIGLVVPKLRYADGRYQLSVDQFPTFTRKIQRLFALRSMEKSSEPPNKLTKVDYAISAYWLLPKKTLEVVGLLDEKIFYSPEDVDYCVRVWLAGLTVAYSPDANAIHDAQELSRRKKLNSFVLRHASGLMYYFMKYQCFFSLAPLRERIRRSQAGLPETSLEA
jgi:GT2 family glycosyltransferase